MTVHKPINLRQHSQQTTQREMLTKKGLVDLLAGLPDEAEIRVDIKLNDLSRAKKCMPRGSSRLEFELAKEAEVDETGINIVGWVHGERLPNASERIMGVVLVEREVGLVKWFNDSKGLGFILREDGQDVFVHYEAIRGDGFRCLRAGAKVEYTLYQTSKGLQAQDVITLSEAEEAEEQEEMLNFNRY